MNARYIPKQKLENAVLNMGIDEAILEIVSKTQIPTLRFYEWEKPAVAIGYFQNLHEEVHYEACLKDNVDIFRRMTGGGAVYKHPNGELNYSFVAPEKLVSFNVLESYNLIGSAVILGLKKLGINAQLSGINDIVLNQKKISGNAQTRKNGVVLQHGTILLDFDVNKMIKYLKIPIKKLDHTKIKEIRHRVGTIKELFPQITIEQLEENIKKGFKEQFNLEFITLDLNETEKQLSQKYFKEKYSTKEWIFWI